MARIQITYDNGLDEAITAAKVVKDIDEGQYHLTDADGRTVALIPADNVLSIVRLDDETITKGTDTYPYKDGDFTVLGPEIFATADGEVICWKGENYTRQPAVKVVNA